MKSRAKQKKNRSDEEADGDVPDVRLGPVPAGGADRRDAGAAVRQPRHRHVRDGPVCRGEPHAGPHLRVPRKCWEGLGGREADESHVIFSLNSSKSHVSQGST